MVSSSVGRLNSNYWLVMIFMPMFVFMTALGHCTLDGFTWGIAAIHWRRLDHSERRRFGRWNAHFNGWWYVLWDSGSFSTWWLIHLPHRGLLKISIKVKLHTGPLSPSSFQDWCVFSFLLPRLLGCMLAYWVSLTRMLKKQGKDSCGRLTNALPKSTSQFPETVHVTLQHK